MPILNTNMSKSVYIILGFINIVIFFLLQFLYSFYFDSKFHFFVYLADTIITITIWCVLYFFYSTIVLLSNKETNFLKSSRQKFFSIYTFLLSLSLVIIELSLIIISKSCGFRKIQLLFTPGSIYILSVYISVLLMPIIILMYILHFYHTNNNSLKYFERLCNLYKNTFLGEIVSRFIIIIIIGGLPIIYLTFSPFLEMLNRGFFIGELTGGGLLIDGILFILINSLVMQYISFAIFTVIMRRIYTYIWQLTSNRKMHVQTQASLEQQKNFNEEKTSKN